MSSLIIEAMAAGVPVISPFGYKVLFEDAALYADLSDVQSIVQRLVSDPALYESQIKRAFEGIDKKFGYSMHVDGVKTVKKRSVIGQHG